jgi:hypothetical protein
MARSKAKSSAAPNLKLLPAQKPTAPPVESSTDALAEDKLEPVEVLLDGKRVVIDARDEIVLRCGKASITLRRNGRIVIRGTYVETRAEGVNRIQGGSVQIN